MHDDDGNGMHTTQSASNEQATAYTFSTKEEETIETDDKSVEDMKDKYSEHMTEENELGEEHMEVEDEAEKKHDHMEEVIDAGREDVTEIERKANELQSVEKAEGLVKEEEMVNEI